MGFKYQSTSIRVSRTAINDKNNINTEPTLVALSHDSVTQRQSSEELAAERTLLSPQLLHQAGGWHEEASARERIPAQVHGLLAGREKGGTQPCTDLLWSCWRTSTQARMKRAELPVCPLPWLTRHLLIQPKGHYLNILRIKRKEYQ